MKIIKKIKSLFNKKIDLDDDDYLIFEPIYISYSSFMFLIEYSQSKSQHVVEFLDACSKCNDVFTYACTVSKNNNVNSKKKNEFVITPEDKLKDKNCLFVSCNSYSAEDIIFNSINLSNQVLLLYIDCLYLYYSNYKFEKSLKAGILKNIFKYRDLYSPTIKLTDQFISDDPQFIYSKIKGIIPKSVMHKIIRHTTGIFIYNLTFTDVEDLIGAKNKDYANYNFNLIDSYIKFLFGTNNLTSIKLYMNNHMCFIEDDSQEEDDNYNVQLDDTFKEKHDIFNPIYEDDEEVSYEDISEIITSEDENQDMNSNDE